MSQSEKPGPVSAILQAIQAKRDRKTGVEKDIADLEASLLADIETFDLDAAERRARREYLANSGAGMVDPTLVFPDIVPNTPAAKPAIDKAVDTKQATSAPKKEEKSVPEAGGSFLNQLRQRAEILQKEIHSAQTERTSTNEAVDQALKHLFFYLHELVQQLNILKPDIPRNYVLIEQLQLSNLAWQEGFSDYRTQSQAAGALIEMVTFSYHLKSSKALRVERDGPSVDRFRTMLFDFGLPFTCKEFKNERSYVERAEFEIRSEVSVSVRWRADYTKGVIVVETRNLERLGSAVYNVSPHCVDQALLDDFGRLIVGQPNRFRELAKR